MCRFRRWHLGQREAYLPAARGFDAYLGIPYSDDMGEARASSCDGPGGGRSGMSQRPGSSDGVAGGAAQASNDDDDDDDDDAEIDDAEIDDAEIDAEIVAPKQWSLREMQRPYVEAGLALTPSEAELGDPAQAFLPLVEQRTGAGGITTKVRMPPSTHMRRAASRC